ncbi:MAG TPA: hypothetical protein VKU01_16630 [Bryobacteraceae bacterium]|nr:hypothetical protein [Bryobacteraceae bacterium]
MNCQDTASFLALHAAGRLTPADSAALTAHLDQCSLCADARLRDSIQAQEVDTASLDRRIRERIASERRSSFPAWLAAAACVTMLLAGIGGYRFYMQSRVLPVCAAAASDHRAEVTQHHPRKWLLDLVAISTLAERQGFSGSVVARLAPPGYHLDRGKLCRLDGSVFLHLVYTDGAQEFSAFLRSGPAQDFPGYARDTVNGRSLYSAGAGTQKLAYFRADNLTAMFVTDAPGDAALSLARFGAGAL